MCPSFEFVISRHLLHGDTPAHSPTHSNVLFLILSCNKVYASKCRGYICSLQLSFLFLPLLPLSPTASASQCWVIRHSWTATPRNRRPARGSGGGGGGEGFWEFEVREHLGYPRLGSMGLTEKDAPGTASKIFSTSAVLSL